MIWFLLFCISFSLFWVYNIVTWIYFGIPYSLSGTYYMLNNKREGNGVWFSIYMITSFLLLMPAWMALSGMINSLGSYLMILPFITCGCMCFVGIAPNIRTSERIEKIHTISAFVGAVTAILWVCIVCWKIMYIFPICVLVCGGIAHLTKTAKTCRDYWLEMSAFSTVFITILVEFILLVL